MSLSELELYRSVFDNSMDAVLLTAPDGRIMMANRASAELFGYTQDQLCALGRDAVVDPGDARLAPALEERREKGYFRGEITMRRKDGSRLEVELSSAVFRDQHGAEWTSMSIRDITERKLQEAERGRLLGEIAAERRWLTAVLENVPLSVLLFEPNGRLSFNHVAEETLGMKLSASGGSAQYRSRVLFRDGTPVTPDQMISTRVLTTGETIAGAEFLIERQDGSRVPILGSAGPIRDSDGRIIGAIGLFQDVSERMRAEEAVRASERLLNGVFELLPVGVWIADPSGRIVRGNQAAISIWGGARYVGTEEFGQYRGWWADTGRPIDAEEWALARAIHNGETSIGEVVRIQCFDGSYKTIINSALPLHDDRGRRSGAIVVNEDITLLKDTEGALRRAIDSRERVLEAVAHDLRHPLQVILSLVQALLVTGERPRQDREALRDVEDQIRRMDRLIQDLLDVAQLESVAIAPSRTRIRPEALLDDAWQTYRRLASASSIELVRDVASGLPDIDGDRERLARVLVNLVSNAIKYTPRSGRVTVGATPGEGCVRFWVSDTGAGMDADTLAHIFISRWRADGAQRGAGLGLAIAKAIVEAQGGRIWAESTPGRGTTVSFTVPSVAD